MSDKTHNANPPATRSTLGFFQTVATTKQTSAPTKITVESVMTEHTTPTQSNKPSMSTDEQYEAFKWALEQAKEWQGYWAGSPNDDDLKNYKENLRKVEKALVLFRLRNFYDPKP